MLLSTSTQLFLALPLVFSSSLAAPTRTHCHCAIISLSTSRFPLSTPSTAHWTPADPSTSTSPRPNLCANLGPELEHFRHTAPDLYEAYIRDASSSSSQTDQDPIAHPIPTTVLLAYSGQGRRRPNALGADDAEDDAQAPLQPRQRIVCDAGSAPVDGEQTSLFNLWALQIIIGVAIFACVAECALLGMQWYVSSSSWRYEQVEQ